MSLKLRKTDAGIEMTVRASPGSRSNEIRGVHEGALKIAVTAAPEKGKANDAIIKLLAKELRLAKKNFSIVGGEINRLKKFSIAGIELEDLRDLLDRMF